MRELPPEDCNYWRAAKSPAGHYPAAMRPEQSQKRAAPLRALMVAAAIDDDSLAADGTYNLALSQVESMLVVRNGCDKVLKWYPRIYGRRGPEALGYAGPIRLWKL